MAFEEKQADELSDRIIDLLNERIKRPDCSPVSLLAGQCLGMLGYLQTAGSLSLVPEIQSLQKSCMAYLDFVMPPPERTDETASQIRATENEAP